MKQDITITELVDSYDWGNVFGDKSSGETTRDMESPDGTSLAPVSRDDVAEIITAINGENEGGDWAGVFRLKDGRFLAATGECDYTGWDCQASNTLTVACNEKTVVRYGLTDSQREDLGYQRLGKQIPEIDGKA